MKNDIEIGMHLKALFLLITLLLFRLSTYAILTPLIDSIPLKDGRHMAVDIYKPTGMLNGPVILIQTPYNRQLYRFGLPMGIGNNLNSSNYIFVVADWRGFYGSKKAAYPGSPTMGDDGYSAVEWIASQTWSNGKVGTWGPSALGRVQYQTAAKNPPHLTCICPLVAAPQYDYNEYFPNGNLRTEYVQQLDQLGFGLSKTLMAHPYYDNTWTFVEAANNYPDSIRVPCFMIGGWYDHTIEFMLPFFNQIRNSSAVNVRDKHKILVGPWVHGGHGTAQVGTNVQGELTYPNSAAWNDSMAMLYFDYYLRSQNNGWDLNAFVTYYQMGDNKWQRSAIWPPNNTTDILFYLHKDGSIDNAKSISTTDSLSFNYDPTNPSPTVGGSTLRNDLVQGPYDQVAKVESRNDILIFSTATLGKDVVLKGSVKIHLIVSSDKLDTDFDVRLTDVYPDGRSMLVLDKSMRMRFRNGLTFASTSMLVAGKVYDCELELPATCITFLAGHKIRLDISSSNYPRFNRNMNNGGAMYPGNSLDSLLNPLVAKNTVYVNSVNASLMTMPLVGYSSSINTPTMQPQFLLYPNPSSEFINIELPNINLHYTIKIYNALGALVYAKAISKQNNVPIAVGHLVKGMYVVQLSDGTQVLTQHFVKP
ncbi:MAG: CocE/NonD family hydrolase [bacterium]|nr:CocE/NonD family hydrolase [bacterium]